LIKSIHFHELEQYNSEFKLDNLRSSLGAENYTTYRTFKTRVLIPAVNEINSYSDKNVVYEPIKDGKSVVSIKFTISTKDVIERVKLQSDIEKEFGLDQLTLWDALEDKL
jgi:plasmid replication initiation protein